MARMDGEDDASSADGAERCWAVEIPHDVLIEIFKETDLYTVTRCLQVCRHWRSCAIDNEIWEFMFAKAQQMWNQLPAIVQPREYVETALRAAYRWESGAGSTLQPRMRTTLIDPNSDGQCVLPLFWDGRHRVLTGGCDGAIYAFSDQGHRFVRDFVLQPPGSMSVLSMCSLQDGSRRVAVATQHNVTVLRIDDDWAGAEVQTQLDEAGQQVSEPIMQTVPVGGTEVLAAGFDRTLRLWNVESACVVARASETDSRAEAVMDAALLDAHTVASVEAVLGWRLWDVRQALRCVCEMNYDEIRLTRLCCADPYLFVTGFAGRVWQHDVRMRRRDALAEFVVSNTPQHANVCWSIATSGSLLLAGSITGSVQVFRTRTPEAPVAELPLHSIGVRSIQAHWARGVFVTGSWDRHFGVGEYLPLMNA